MLRKLLLLTLLYFIPLTYLDVLVPGVANAHTFPALLIMGLFLGACIVLSNILSEFLTIKKSIIARLVLVSIIIFVALNILPHYLPYITITDGNFAQSSFFQFAPLMIRPTYMSRLVVVAATSLLLAIWGIIINLLLS